MTSRRFAEASFVVACGLCAAASLACLAAILVAILVRGVPSVSLTFLTDQITAGGAAGGIVYNLVGTTILLATAAITTVTIPPVRL